MITSRKLPSLTISGFVLASLVACGGGSGGTASTVTPSRLTGTAATGAALANASVAITNTAGTSPCSEPTITTTELGSYTCTLKTGETAPFFIVVTDPTGNTTPLVSIATTTPAAGTPLLVNATPLTTAIVAQLNGGDALGVISNKALYVPATFDTAKTNVIAQIQAVVTSIDPSLSNYDPFTTSITAATAGGTGNTADQILDVIKISTTSSGALALSTISDPTPVPLATSTTAGTAVTAPTTSVSDLAKSAQLAASAFTNCYALPVSQRVTLDANLGITSVAAECQNIVVTAGNPTNSPEFKHNGFIAKKFFYDSLTSSLMTGAKFSVPEIMAFYPADANNSRDRAVLNMRYIDGENNPGNFITVAQNFPGSSTTTRPSNWWITGNQSEYDISVSTNIRRIQEYYPNYASRFQNGLNIYINGKETAPNASLYDSALVTGPGLPTAGLWYTRSSVANGFSISSVRSTSPQLPANLTLVCPSCNSYWMSRTKGLTGVDATTLATNSTNANWATSSDGSYNGTNDSRPTKGAVYTFKLYKDATLVTTEKRAILSDLIPATQAVNLQWNGIGENTAAAMDITNNQLNGTQASMTVDWTQNPSAEKIKNIWVSQNDGGFDNTTKFSISATSVVATPRGTGVLYTTPLGPQTSNPYGGYREIGFAYRMLDGSTKVAVYTYSP